MDDEMTKHLPIGIVLISLLILSPLAVSARTQQPSGYVIYRIDDIQSGWLPNVQSTLLDEFISHNTKASLGIIPFDMRSQGGVYKKIKIGLDYGLFEIDAHGW